MDSLSRLMFDKQRFCHLCEKWYHPTVLTGMIFVSKMSPVPKVRLSGGLEICRILNGMWQVSGSHGAVDKAKAGKRKARCDGNIHKRCAG